MEESQPGRVISPSEATPLEQPAFAQTTSPPLSQQAPLPPAALPQSQVTQQQTPQNEPVTEPYDSSVAADSSVMTQDQEYESDLAWVAPEMVHPPKGATWYGAYTLGAILLGGFAFLITRDVVSTVVVVVAVFALIFVASRTPKNQQYALYDGHLQVNQRVYALQDFRAFSSDEQQPVTGITLWPLKRFMPPVVLYAPAEHTVELTEYLARLLPMQTHKPDVIDSLLNRIRF